MGCPLKLAPPCLVETGSTEETPRLIPDPASPAIKEDVTWVQGQYNITRGRDKIWLPSNGLQHSPRLFTVPHERTGGMQPAPSSSSKKFIHILLQNIPLPPNSLKKKPSCRCKRTYGPTCTRAYPWLVVYLEESINSSKTRPRARNSYEGEGQTDWRNCTLFPTQGSLGTNTQMDGWDGMGQGTHVCSVHAKKCTMPSLQRGKR